MGGPATTLFRFLIRCDQEGLAPWIRLSSTSKGAQQTPKQGRLRRDDTAYEIEPVKTPNPSQTRIAEAMRESVVSVLRTEGIYGRGYRFRDAREYLSQTNLFTAVQSMALINAVASRLQRIGDYSKKENLAHLGRLYRFLFHVTKRPTVVNFTVKELLQKFGPFIPLSPWACAAMTDACLRFCHLTSGRHFFPPSEVRYFSKILVSFQTDLAPDHSGLPDFENMPDALFSEFVRNQLRANSQRLTKEDHSRLYALFSVPEVGEVLQLRAKTSAAEWFKTQTGMNAADYRTILFALMATTMEFTLDQPNFDKLTFDLTAFLGGVLPEAQGHFIRLIELALIDIPAVRAERPPANWKEAVYGANSLVRRQLVRLGETRFVILHEDLFVERYFRGMVHVLDDLARQPGSGRDWQTTRSEFGYLFEGYVRWWLRGLLGEKSITVFGVELQKGKGETDAIVIVGRTALVFEFNHHPLSRVEAFEATPAKLAAIVSSDLKKAFRAARIVAAEGLVVGGKRHDVDRILPVVVLPDALPISDLTAIRFRQELLKTVPDLQGDGTKICAAQIMSQTHLELYDKVWNLPAECAELVEYLAKRASLEPARFGPVVFDRQQLSLKYIGNTWSKLHEACDREFATIGPTWFKALSPSGPEEALRPASRG
ncbi:MAG: hypothetical protein JWM32_3097 [Verrucomicrobia bacterium]|nr:hypothetical protein [Verrucomicrobiota bacterium]